VKQAKEKKNKRIVRFKGPITSTKEVVFPSAFVSLFVSRITQELLVVFTKFGGKVVHPTEETVIFWW